MINVPKVLKIVDIIEETPTIKTFVFYWDMKKNGIPNPGEFVMVWNFNDEKPMSISFIDKFHNRIGITIKKVGSFTEDIHKLSIGDKLGIRGSYGNGFNMDLEDKKILAIGAGVGMAPINAFCLDLLPKGANIDVVSSAINKDELLFVENLKNKGANVYTSTDDGSCGFKGFAIHKVQELLDDKSYDVGVVCGPEIMMEGIFKLFKINSIYGQFSMERYMKCAVGICGQCCVDNTGWRICKEGPVFSGYDMKEISEFGKYHRNSAGIKKYY